jgi:hypothetical protein
MSVYLLALTFALSPLLGSSNDLAFAVGRHGGGEGHGGGWHGGGWHGNGWHGGGWQGGGWHRGGSTIFYSPGYYYPYNTNYQDTCPLIPSHYDADGNWIAATRVCPYGYY